MAVKSDVSCADDIQFGGSAKAVEHHYDVSNAFYALWLDETKTYSAARWSGSSEESLYDAQLAKIDFHLGNTGLRHCGALLDIGCGWGATLQRARQQFAPSRAVGLTLSPQQASYVCQLDLPNVEVRLQSWADYEPEQAFDGIVSIGAFEHFADPRQSAAERLEVYREFFSRCRRWLAPSGGLSLQTIVYGDMEAQQASRFITSEIFPSAELPRPAEIFSAADRIMRIESYENRPLDYARTCEAWAAALRAPSRRGDRPDERSDIRAL